MNLERIRSALFAPVDIAFLVFFRIVFGAAMLVEVYRYFSHDWIARYYIEPKVFFAYYGFEWVHPWPGHGMYWHFLALGVLAACILLGFCYRIAAPLFFLGFTYVFLLDETRYLNHFYLVCLLAFLLVFLPAERAWSLDAWLNPKIRTRAVPAWTLYLLRAQIAIAYIYAGLSKISWDWLHGEPMRAWLARRTDFPLIGRYFTDEWMVYGFVIGGLLLDLFVVPLMLWRPTRIFAFAAAIAFHLLNAALFQIGIFPWLMLGATIIFFPWSAATAVAALPEDEQKRRLRSPHAIVLATYLLIQILVPLRHFLYPGNVNWTEEGHRFAWQMKLRDKEAEALFFVSDPRSGMSWVVDPRQYVTARQLDKLAAQPDMILQFSHYLAEEKRREGYANVEVRAHVSASVNGRKPQPLVDPNVDLAKENRSLRHATWITELTEPLPMVKR